MNPSNSITYCFLLLFFLARSPVFSQIAETFEATRIASSDLPLRFDEERTFVYAYHSANPESLLTVLSNVGIKVIKAWQPLDDHCMAPIGPRFTVELAAFDERVLTYGFTRGAGRLRCSSELVVFMPSE